MDSTDAPKLKILCPHCGARFEELERPVVHPEADQEDPEFTQEGRIATCRKCACAVALDLLEVGEDGIWRQTPDD